MQYYTNINNIYGNSILLSWLQHPFLLGIIISIIQKRTLSLKELKEQIEESQSKKLVELGSNTNPLLSSSSVVPLVRVFQTVCNDPLAGQKST